MKMAAARDCAEPSDNTLYRQIINPHPNANKISRTAPWRDILCRFSLDFSSK
jgi:hypothetical protein